MIFVVEHDHAIMYAGMRFSDAVKAMRGPSKISAWFDGKWIGDLNHKGEWEYKTQHFHDGLKALAPSSES